MLFIFDAHCSKRLAEGLDYLEQGNTLSPRQAQVRHIKFYLAGNATDEEIIKLVGNKGGILVTYDRGFKTLKLRYELYKQYNVGLILFHSFKNVIHYWDIVKSIISRWEELKKYVEDEEKPFAVELTISGFKKLNFK